MDGTIRVVDIHAHYYPQAYLDLLGSEKAKRFGASYTTTPEGFFVEGYGFRQGPLPSKWTNLEERVAEMDAQGVATHALSLTAPMVYWADGAFSQELSAAYNDAVSAAHRAYPDRFVGLMTLPMLDPDRALDELNRASRLPGIRGVYLGTNIHDNDLSEPMFFPVYARIEALGLPIFLHPIKTIGGKRLKPYHLGNFIGNPVDTAIAAAHLIFGGVLDRYPNLEVNLPHAGGTLPILIGRWDHGHRVRKETRHLDRPPSEYLRRFTYDTISHSAPVMHYLVSLVGADRIMLGSDYCADMGYERPVGFVDGVGLAPADRAMILGGTAARLLKL